MGTKRHHLQGFKNRGILRNKILITGISLLLKCHLLPAQYTAYDSVQVFSLLARSESHLNRSDYPAALQLARNAWQISTRKYFLNGEASALAQITTVLIEQGDYSTAAGNPEKLLKIAERLNLKRIQGVAWLQTAQLHMYNARYMLAETAYNRAIGLFTEKEIHAALAWHEKGFNYLLQGDMSSQAACFLRSLSLYEQLNDKPGMAMIYNSLSVMYSNLGQTEKAIEYALKAIAIREQENNVVRLSTSYCNLSQLY
ncbi:MAG: tetratricopeptide repeat protein, partial [Dinghuibacter sp.]|nr:tetratricopeptide repeat protein [Dinghuibacter sp.]